MQLRLSALAFLLLPLSNGCASPAGDCRVASWHPCDIRETSCQQRILAAVQCDRGHELDTLPPVRRITRDEFRAELLAAAERTTPEPEWDLALSMLDLLSSGSTSVEASIEARVMGTAAYYSPDDERITIVDRGTVMDLGDDTRILAHELVHAIQDRRYDLDAFVHDAPSLDALDARRSVVEGDARFFELLYNVRQRAIPLDRIAFDDFYEEYRLGVIESIASAPAPYAQARIEMPYWLGSRAIQLRWMGAGDFLDETSPALVDAMYAAPPTSVAELMDLSLTVSPLDCDAPEPPPGFTVVDDDALGPLGVLAFLASRGEPDAWSVAQGVRADGIRVVTNGPNVAVVWRIREAAASSFPLESWVGEDAPRRVGHRDGRDLVLVAGNDDGLAASWTAAAACH